MHRFLQYACLSDALDFSFFFSSRRRHTRWNCDWSSDVCSSDLVSKRAGRRALEGGGIEIFVQPLTFRPLVYVQGLPRNDIRTVGANMGLRRIGAVGDRERIPGL